MTLEEVTKQLGKNGNTKEERIRIKHRKYKNSK